MGMSLYHKPRHWNFDLLVAVEKSHPLGTMTAHKKITIH